MLLAAPTAKRLVAAPVAIAAKDSEVLPAKIRWHHRDELVSVGGHSNTVPAILKGLGYAGTVMVTEEDFDDLFFVASQRTVAPTGCA